jgi:hypothetical protein
MWLISDLHCNINIADVVLTEQWKWFFCLERKVMFIETYLVWNTVLSVCFCMFLYVSFNGILQWNLFKPKTCLNQTHFTVLLTKCLCNFSLCKPSTCLNWANYSVPKGFGLDRFHCTIKISKNRTLDFPLIFN